MRIALVGLIALVGAREASADCGCHARLMTERVAAGTATLVVDASCVAGATLGLELRAADGTKLATKLVKTYGGHSGFAQYALEPTKPLAAGTYGIAILGAHGSSKQTLTVVDATKQAPAWSAEPKLTTQTRTEFGCGPAQYIGVQVGTQTPLAFVTLVDTASKQSHAGYVPISDKGELLIGHGMCGGMFEPVKGREYTASITLWSPVAPGTSPAKSLTVRYMPKTR
jgi:hypothetical protein